MVFNIEEHLNKLDENIKMINISHKNLTYIPDLSRFKNLKILLCCHNRLTNLPNLNESLKILYCKSSSSILIL